MTGQIRILLAVVLVVVICAAGAAAFYFLMPSSSQTVAIPTADSTPANTSANAAPATPAPAPADDPASIAGRIAGKDQAARDDAVAQLNALAGSDPHELGVGMPKWGPSLFAAGYFDDADNLLKTVIMRRAMDIGTLEAAQRLRAMGMIAHAKAQTLNDARDDYFAQALPEAKGYYDVAALSATAEAANMLAEVLAQTSSVATATEFLKQQADLDAGSPTSRPSAVFRSIPGDNQEWDFDVQYLLSRVGSKGASYSSLMCQGEYYLIDDQPGDALRSFQGACKIAGSKTKQVRDAEEGVARAMRAQDGNVARAVAFVQSLKSNPAEAGSDLRGSTPDSPSVTDLKSAAGSIKLPDLSKLDTAPPAPK
jgi:hypothetical protein